MDRSRLKNAQSINNSPIRYPILTQKDNPNNPFVMFNESNLPNYTNPVPMHPSTHTHNKLDNFVDDNGGASSASTSFNIIKGIMGVALLTLPWSIANVGLLPSVIFLFLSFILSYISWIFLCLLCEHYNVYSYRDIGLVVFGPWFATVLDLVLLVFLYLISILYVMFLSQFIIAGLAAFNISIDTTTTFANLYLIESFHQFVCTKFFIITVTLFGILFPLSLLKHLDSLKYSSFLGIIAYFYVIGLVAFAFCEEKQLNGYYISPSVVSVNFHSNTGQEDQLLWFWMSSFNLFVASFNTHFNGPALYGELKGKTPRKFIRISSVSFVVALVLNLLLGLCGYFAFGLKCNQNILITLDVLNFGLVVAAAQLIMTLTIIGTYPLLFWNIKVSCDNLFLYQNVMDENHTKVKKIPRKYTCACSKIFLYFMVTITIWMIAIFADDVAVILSFMEALLGNAIVFIFPAILYLTMIQREKKGSNVKRFLVTIMCYIVVIFGVACIIGGSVSSIMFWTGYIS
eukprot:240441_1